MRCKHRQTGQDAEPCGKVFGRGFRESRRLRFPTISANRTRAACRQLKTVMSEEKTRQSPTKKRGARFVAFKVVLPKATEIAAGQAMAARKKGNVIGPGADLAMKAPACSLQQHLPTAAGFGLQITFRGRYRVWIHKNQVERQGAGRWQQRSNLCGL